MASLYPSSSQAAARLSYLGISAIVRRQFSSSITRADNGQFQRSDFTGHGFTGYWDSGPTEGPLKDASSIGAPRITPRSLKEHLDQFVVGQERAKKVLSVAVYNHYQRVHDIDRQDEEIAEQQAKEARRERARDTTHPLEGTKALKDGVTYLTDLSQDEFPGQQRTVNVWNPNAPSPLPTPHGLGAAPLIDSSPLMIEKSNIMLLGPSGVGKTLMAKTLARVLEVPFSMSDCTPFTQAGYIGEDADVCVQRLLAAANYDVAKAERGIICLDEIDKIATAKVSHGKDVSGEGVQQALLKIIEGTTLQIQAKQERGSAGGSSGRGTGANAGGSPTNSPLGGGPGQQQPGKAETYNVRTDNILFICTGAFIGLHKMIMDRVSKGSIGFGANVRASALQDAGPHETTLHGQDELFRKHLPYYVAPPPAKAFSGNDKSSGKEATYNTLDLVEPSDLQKYGLIPELVGRVPISCALSALDTDALVKVLTEPRNSLLKQYEQLLQLSSIELRFTSPALYAIAEAASSMGTGARGLRTVMERLLGDAMFETPGSGVKYIAITEDVARRKCAAVYFNREGRAKFTGLIAREEEEWEDRKRAEEGSESEFERRARVNSEGGAATTFEEYRQKTTAAGFA